MDLNQKYTLLPSRDFFYDLVNEIKLSKERIYLQAMVIEFNDISKILADELKNAKRRGVDVKVTTDWRSKLYFYSHHWFIPILNKRKRIEYTKLKKLNNTNINYLKINGIEITYTNKPFPLIGKFFTPIGRNHIKIMVVDDIVYTGGMNLGDEYIKNVDFMIKTKEKSWVRELSKQFFNVNEKNLEEDLEIDLGNGNTLLIDSGKIGKSIIYRRALEIIYSTKKNIKFISQYFPDTKVLFALKHVEKLGIDIEIIGDRDKRLIFKIQQWIFDRLKGSLKELNYTKSHIHTKLMLADTISEGSVAIFGSHNLSLFGILFGTNEIAILTKEKELIKILLGWYEDFKKETS